jgi:Rrf2 family protein
VLSSRFAVAVHILAVQAFYRDRALTSQFIAGSVNTNPVVVRRILGRLRRAGLVRLRSGPQGGSELVKAPSRIKLAEVYKAVEPGELLALHRSKPNPHCPVGSCIQDVLSGVFTDAEEAFDRALGGTSLADVARDVERRGRRAKL